MKSPILLFIFILSPAFSSGLNGIDITWSHPFGNVVEGSLGVFSLSYLTPNPKLTGYLEFGMTGMPEMSWDENNLKHSHSTVSFIGLYAGHTFLAFRGLVRPGFQIGSVYETRTDYTNRDGTFVANDDGYESSMQPFFAFKIQTFFLTFIFSNKGIGGGVNLSV